MPLNTPTPRDILIAARARIAEPERWTQDAWARDKSGHVRLDPRHALAEKWDARGAIYKECEGHPDELYATCVALVGEHLSGGIAYGNDYNTHEQVRAAFDRAIGECR